jgi:hypothetical protein
VRKSESTSSLRRKRGVGFQPARNLTLLLLLANNTLRGVRRQVANCAFDLHWQAGSLPHERKLAIAESWRKKRGSTSCLVHSSSSPSAVKSWLVYQVQASPTGDQCLRSTARPCLLRRAFHVATLSSNNEVAGYLAVRRALALVMLSKQRACQCRKKRRGSLAVFINSLNHLYLRKGIPKECVTEVLVDCKFCKIKAKIMHRSTRPTAAS